MSRMVFAVGLTLALSGMSPAAAQDRQDHIKRTNGPGVDTFDAGVVCDFAYEIEWFETLNVKRFYDDQGNRIRALWQVYQKNQHRNLDTGFTLDEEVHFTIERDFVTGEQIQTGNNWALRTDGRLVFLAAGRSVLDLWTGEVYEATPNAATGFTDVICPLLGGAPAE